MTSSEYASYCADVETFLADFEGEPSTGYWPGECPCCEDEDACSCEREPHFAWSPCDCCRSSLGGDRMDSIGWFKGANAHDYDTAYRWSGALCVDCEYFLAYGRLDDMTMLEIEEKSGAEAKRNAAPTAFVETV